MPQPTYRILLDGIQQGADESRVVQALQQLYRVDQQRIEQLLARLPAVVGKDLDATAAQSLQQALTTAGVVSRVEQEAPVTTIRAPGERAGAAAARPPAERAPAARPSNATVAVRPPGAPPAAAQPHPGAVVSQAAQPRPVPVPAGAQSPPSQPQPASVANAHGKRPAGSPRAPAASTAQRSLAAPARSGGFPWIWVVVAVLVLGMVGVVLHQHLQDPPVSALLAICNKACRDADELCRTIEESTTYREHQRILQRAGTSAGFAEAFQAVVQQVETGRDLNQDRKEYLQNELDNSGIRTRLQEQLGKLDKELTELPGRSERYKKVQRLVAAHLSSHRELVETYTKPIETAGMNEYVMSYTLAKGMYVVSYRNTVAAIVDLGGDEDDLYWPNERAASKDLLDRVARWLPRGA